MRQRYIIVIFSIILSMLHMPILHAAEKSQDVYDAITQQEGWLNTSRALKADDLKGRIVLLDFWTYCCINCIQIMPELTYLEETFGDKLTVIGVHSAKFKNERDTSNIRQAILRHDIKHPVVNDYNFATWKAMDVQAWPTLVLIDPQGKVVKRYSGEGHTQDIERDVKSLLAQYEGTLNSSSLPVALEKTKAPQHELSFPTKMIYVPDYPDRAVFMIADSGNHRILVLTEDGHIVDQIGTGKAGRRDGEFASVQFTTPQGLAYQNHMLYIADTGNHLIRAAHFGLREVSSVAGTGKQGYDRTVQGQRGLKTALASPWDLAFYPDNTQLAVAMAGTHQLWGYDISGKTVNVLAGNGKEYIDDGAYPDNSLSQPSGMAAYDDVLYFVDAETSSLRMLKDGEVTTLIGKGLFDFGYVDGDKHTARMQHPLGIAAGKDMIYIADSYNHTIRKYDLKNGVLSTLAGQGVKGKTDGALDDARFNEPNDLTLVNDTLYVTDTNNHAIRVIDLKAKTVSTIEVSDQQSMVDRFSEALPNLDTTIPLQEVTNDEPIKVLFNLDNGWKINREAPSNLTLFAMDAASPKAIARYNQTQMLGNRVLLPKLNDGHYRLQGTLYYCEDKKGAQCLLKSFDVKITAGTGGPNVISLLLY